MKPEKFNWHGGIAPLLLLLFGLTACQKESMSPVGANLPAEVNITNRVKAFVDHANHQSNFKGRTSVSLDSAIWYLEAGVNYSAAQAWIGHNEIVVDSIVSSPRNQVRG